MCISFYNGKTLLILDMIRRMELARPNYFSRQVSSPQTPSDGKSLPSKIVSWVHTNFSTRISADSDPLLAFPCNKTITE